MARVVRCKDLDDFASKMRVLALEIEDGENRLVREVALNIHTPLVLDTAVDTGEARSNWVVTLGGPFGAAIGPYAPGRHLGLSERGNARVAIAQGVAVVSARGTGVPIFITNLADHIGALNDGDVNFRPENQGARTGFIEQAIDEGATEAFLTVDFLP